MDVIRARIACALTTGLTTPVTAVARVRGAGYGLRMSRDQGVFTLGHSPDPDDAFMFYAMAENKIDLRGYRFEHRLEDIQTLNERATRGELHISAISIHAYAYVSDKYALMPCGASMGDGYGPLVITKTDRAANADADLGKWLRSRVIA